MQKRIVSLALLTAVMATMLFGFPFAAGVFRYYEVAERMRLERIADEVAIDFPARAVERHEPVPLPADVAGTRAAVYDAEGHLISGAGPGQADAAVLDSIRIDDAAYSGMTTTLVCAVPLTSRGRVVGAVRVEGTSGGIYERSVITWAQMLCLAAAVAVVTWLVAARLARRLARPLEQVSAKAWQFGEGDFGVRFEHTGIPEIDAVGRCLNRTAIQLADMLERERAFSADVSHQLRTPLTGLRLSLETALEDRHLDHTPALERALSAVDVLEDTVSDLLVMARETHRPSQPLEVEPLINDLVSRTRWQEELAASGRWLRTVIRPDAPTPHASPSAVRQILTVLVENAMIHGSGPVTITARDASGILAIDVTDQGSCADLDEQEIFQRRSDSAAGNGIGLALARSLAQTQGGQLGLTSRSPTSFTLFLPVRDIPL